MTINSTASALSTNAANALYKSSTSTASSSSSASSTTELTQEEQQYDIDNDGELSTTEEASMQKAQALQKTLQSVKTSGKAEAASIEISAEALKMQQQNRSEPPNEGAERTETGDSRQKLFNEAISQYKKLSIE